MRAELRRDKTGRCRPHLTDRPNIPEGGAERIRQIAVQLETLPMLFGRVKIAGFIRF